MSQVFSSVVVGTDGSDTAAKAVRHAIGLALELGSSLKIVSAYEPRVGSTAPRRADVRCRATCSGRSVRASDVLALLEAEQAEARVRGVGTVETFARQGDAADAILDVAEEQRPT